MIQAVLLSYFLGSIPTAFIIGKLNGIDIRKQGSGNVGATNVFRVMGKCWGSLVLFLDILKGFLASFFTARAIYQDTLGISFVSFQLISGFFAIIGHTWPIWLGFRGGKGVATSCGAFLGIYPQPVFAALGVWILTAFLCRYVSLASMLAAFSFPIFLFIFYRKQSDFMIGFAISILLFLFIVYMHRSNIKRLLSGTENKIGNQPKR